MMNKICDFIQTNHNAIRGVVFHRFQLSIILVNSQKVFDTSVCTNDECAVITRELDNLFRRK